MTRYFPLAASALALCLCSVAASAQLTEAQAASGKFPQHDQGTAIKPAAEPHFAAGQKAAGKDWIGPLLLCNQARPEALKWQLPGLKEVRQIGLAQGEMPATTKIFDNMIYFGNGSVNAFAVVTSQGIILIDSLNNGNEAANIIDAGLRKFGYDPAQIKYVVVTHGHGDHYGGAGYFQRKYHAHILMSETDWALSPMTRDKPFFDPAPPRDLVIQDGEKLELGGETLSLFITPGHTPGTVSVLIPVTDHGHRHVVALWGGAGFNFPHSPARFATYAASAQRFLGLALAAGADVPISNHPENDASFLKIKEFTTRGAGDPNPYVMGTEQVRRFFTTLSECAQAYGAQIDG